MPQQETKRELRDSPAVFLSRVPQQRWPAPKPLCEVWCDEESLCPTEMGKDNSAADGKSPCRLAEMPAQWSLVSMLKRLEEESYVHHLRRPQAPPDNQVTPRLKTAECGAAL
jgi:hypothetical protein